MLANNALTALPPELGFWQSVQGATLTGNPLRAIRQNVVAQGWAAVVAWLRDRLPEGSPQSVELPRTSKEPAYEGILGLGSRQVSSQQAAAQLGRQPSSPASAAVPGYKAQGSRPSSGLLSGPPSGPASARSDLGPRLDRLRQVVAGLEEELAQPGLGRQKQSTLGHSLRMKRAELLKAER
eukprot:TRINITY_DN95230_c0_g1_i1.p1 TRINITY_DN95230_c0_g1~~TRINITY_DN95230_c0_g1_i1.p1  ORF type:complete len:181 (+),score=31.25 TRINITY_DN95230_c0_g1_i1:242-784(+)